MQGIEVTLNRNKQFTVENLEEYKVIGSENNATTILVHFPTEYENYSKRVDFKNIKNEKWTIALYTPEDETKQYGSSFDKRNFSFTLPSAVTIKGELKIQFIAYLPNESEIFVPFEILKIEVEDDIMYVKKKGSQNPDLILKAYEYSNMALMNSREGLTRAEDAERAALEAERGALAAQNSASASQQSAKQSQTSANAANQRATNAERSATEAQASALEAQNSARSAENDARTAVSVSNTANTNSQNAVNTSNESNTKSTKTLEIIDNLTVSSSEINCREHISVAIETNATTKHKNIHFKVPAPKQGTSYRNKGAWDASIQYINDEYFIDTVSKHGCTYFCKITNKNNEPTSSAENEYWGLLAIKGSDAGVTIEDNLNSTHADYVLSAKQGRILKELIASSIETAITNLINNAPTNLNTLKKLADAIDSDPRFGTTVKNLITTNANNITKIINGTMVVENAHTSTRFNASDTRSVNSLPSYYMSNQSKAFVMEFKHISAISLSHLMSGEYCQLITITPWGDSSGGYPTQVAFGQGTICFRVATTPDVWGAWKIIVTSDNASTLGDIRVRSIDIITT